MNSKIRILLLGALGTAAMAILPAHAAAHIQAGSSPNRKQPVSKQPVSDANSVGLAEVIVTAQKRSQNIQDVPITIAALSGQQLAVRGITKVEDLVKASPGVLITEYGGTSTTTAIGMRGVVQLDFLDHQESPIALYVDGAYVSFQGATGGSMFDVDSVEILRGPQGTLFGRNATGGLVQINSRKPTDHLDGYIQASYGSFNRFNAEGAIGDKIAGNLTGRIAFSFNRQDGFYKNDRGPDLGGDQTLNGRLQLEYKFSENTKNLFEASVSRNFPVNAGAYVPYPIASNPATHGLTQPNDGQLFVDSCAANGFTVAAGATNCFGYVRPAGLSKWDIDTPFVGEFDRTVYSFINTFTHEMSFAKLTSISNYMKFIKDYNEETSSSPMPINRYYEDTRAYQFSQELRLNGSTPRLTWVAGLYALRIYGHYGDTFVDEYLQPYLTSAVKYTQGVTTFALFGQGEYKLTDRLSLIAGLRGNIDKKALGLVGFCSADTITCAANGSGPDGAGFAGSDKRESWSDRLQLTYKVGARSMIYVGMNRGNKGSAVVVPITSPLPGTTFESELLKPEVLTAYETGVKTSWLDNRLKLNGDVFYYDYNNMQAYKVVTGFASLFNADARNYGGELQAVARPFRGTTISYSLAALHTKVEGVALPDGFVTNQQAPFAPHLSWNLELGQEVLTDIGIFSFHGGLRHSSSYYFSTINEAGAKQSAYTVADVRVGWSSLDDKTSITASVANLTNKAYMVYAFTNAFYGYTPADYAPPRWFTVQISRKFSGG